MPPSPERCPHCGGDLSPGAPVEKRLRLKGPERLPASRGGGVRAWHVVLAILVALIGTAVAIVALGSAPSLDP